MKRPLDREIHATAASTCSASERLRDQLALSALVGAAASGLGLTGERAGKPLLRIVDPGKARVAERVGESLLENAHKYTDAADASIELSARHDNNVII